MAQLNLGRIKPIYRGVYDPLVPYEVLDFVTFDGITYFCIQNTTAGISPDNAIYWQYLVELDTPLEMLAKLITVDGAGSNLDADLLDGEEGSYYQPAITSVNKNNDTGAALMPTGTTVQRPSTDPEGAYAYIRYNSEFSSWEGSPDGFTWTGLGGATGGAGNPAFYENDIDITADYTITTGKNAITAGPVTIADGVTVTVPDGSTWSIV